MSTAEFRPYDAEFAADPYPIYAHLRATHPILPSAELGMTFLFRYRDIFNVLTDRRLGRTMDQTLSAKEIAARRREENWQALPSYSRYVRVNLLEKEGTDHARLRRVLTHVLSPLRVEALAPKVEAIAAELLADLPTGSEINFIADLAEPMPVRVIADLLGWPSPDRHLLRPWSAAITRLYERDATAADGQRAEDATAEFADRLHTLAKRRRAEPREDLISALVAAEHRPDGLTRDATIATCMLLLNAGHEATVNGAGNGLLALLRHPSQLDGLRRNPGQIGEAVEEMLRYDAPLQLFHRFVLEDMDIGSVTLRRGDKVGLLYGSANRDPDAFRDPDVFRIGRTPNRHLAFGAATHFCLGAPLARLELTTLFKALLKRGARLKLLDNSPTYRRGLVFRGLKSLRIAL